MSLNLCHLVNCHHLLFVTMRLLLISDAVTVSSIFTGGGRREGVRGRWRRQARVTKAAVFLMWVILIFAQLGIFFAVLEENGVNRKFVYYKSHHHHHHQLPRKVRFSETTTQQPTTTTSFYVASSPSNKLLDTEEEDPGSTLYADNKRIIHTGPNPLHN